MTSITLDRLIKTFRSQAAPVLADLSLDVHPGELLALLGPSGSGKSTLLKLIAGIEHPDSGDICFDGQSMLPVPPNRRGAVLVFQNAYLFPFLTVAGNIGFGLKVRHMRRQAIKAEVARMLDLVDLPGSERKYPGQLSGGQQQRVALARALVVKPRVLLLDEPLNSLDTEIRQSLQEVIRRIQREVGITTLLVTHDLREALAMSDRTALLLDGRIEACDRPDRLFQRPPTRAAARFAGVSTFLEGRVEGDHFCCTIGRLTMLALPGRARQATFAIRPEHINLLHPEESRPVQNSVCGRVRDLLYTGEFVEYQIAVADMVVRVKALQSGLVYRPGDVLYVQFPAEKLFEVR